MVMTRQEEFDNALSFVSELMGVAEIDIVSKSRDRDIAVARHFVRYYLRSKCKMTFQMIADFTNSNHATVIHSVKYVHDCSAFDKVYRLYKESIDSGILSNVTSLREKISSILRAKNCTEFKVNSLILLIKENIENGGDTTS
tara:strand:+ start:283 stop:708 length:426 start_codon:yes stop_codon:yes gene_type:complete